MFVKTAFLQICNKFTREHPYRNVIWFATLLNTYFCMGVFLYICCIFSEHIFWRTPMGDCSWICNVIKLVKMMLKSLWYFAYLNYHLLKLFFYNWCNYLIFMYKISKCWEWIPVYNYEKKIIQTYLKTFLMPEITYGSFFWNIQYMSFFQNNYKDSKKVWEGIKAIILNLWFMVTLYIYHDTGCGDYLIIFK